MAKLYLLLIVLMLPWAAQAGVPRYHQHELTISTAACPTGTPGLAPDGEPWGISLSNLRAWKMMVCAEEGETVTGAGSLLVCLYSPAPWGPALWMPAPAFTKSMSSLSSGTRRCVVAIPDTELAIGLSDRVFVYPSTDFGVSGGTSVDVYLVGETR